jgi:hypothetical protein
MALFEMLQANRSPILAIEQYLPGLETAVRELMEIAGA